MPSKNLSSLLWGVPQDVTTFGMMFALKRGKGERWLITIDLSLGDIFARAPHFEAPFVFDPAGLDARVMSIRF